MIKLAEKLIKFDEHMIDCHNEESKLWIINLKIINYKIKENKFQIFKLYIINYKFLNYKL